MAQGRIINALIGASNKAKFPAIQGSALSVNMYYGRNGKDEYMESMPGLKLLKVVEENAKFRGSYVSTIGLDAEHSTEDMFSVFGNTLYRIKSDGTAAALGTLANNGSRVCFAETGGPRALLLVADGVNLFYYDLLEGGNMEAIQMPERITARGGFVNPSHVAVVAGSIVVNDTYSGYCYYSKPYPLANDSREMIKLDANGNPEYEADGVTVKTTMEPSKLHVFEDDYHVQQYFNTESSSDNINGIYAIGPTLYVFGPKTVEIWQRGTGEFEEWIRTSYTSQNSFGLEAPSSLASSGSILYFVASGAQYGKAVMMVSGATFKKISEDWLEEKLLKESTGTAYGFCYSVGEHNFYVLQFPSLGETWCYDALDGGWHQRCSLQASGLEGQWRAGGVAYYREKFFAFTNDGTVCGFHRDYWREDMPDGSTRPLVRHRQTGVIMDNGRPFTLEEIAIECNVGTWEDYADKPYLMLQISKDGGMTFGNVKRASLGRVGDYSHRVRFLLGGLNRKCVMRVTYSHPTELTLNLCEIRAEATGAMI